MNNPLSGYPQPLQSNEQLYQPSKDIQAYPEKYQSSLNNPLSNKVQEYPEANPEIVKISIIASQKKEGTTQITPGQGDTPLVLPGFERADYLTDAQ